MSGRDKINKSKGLMSGLYSPMLCSGKKIITATAILISSGWLCVRIQRGSGLIKGTEVTFTQCFLFIVPCWEMLPTAQPNSLISGERAMLRMARDGQPDAKKANAK